MKRTLACAAGATGFGAVAGRPATAGEIAADLCPGGVAALMIAELDIGLGDDVFTLD